MTYPSLADAGPGGVAGPDAAPFDDIDAFLPALFDVWWAGSEVEWARYAWGVLGDVGLTSCRDELDRARVLVRLLVLAAINRQFAWRARDEGGPGEWVESIELRADAMVGSYPAVEPLAWGMYLHSVGCQPPGVGETLELGHVVGDLIAHEHGVVAEALVGRLGDAELFASLWHNARDETVYPLADELMHEAVNEDPAPNKVDGYTWIESGLPL
jgi:hypothetical protein